MNIKEILNHETLKKQNETLEGTGGVSAGNRHYGFRPAFLDCRSGTVYLSCFADGRPAPFHLLDGLPEAIHNTLVAGFELKGRFYTREQAAILVA